MKEKNGGRKKVHPLVVTTPLCFLSCSSVNPVSIPITPHFRLPGSGWAEEGILTKRTQFGLAQE